MVDVGGKVVVITSADCSIGVVTALELTKKGAAVVLGTSHEESVQPLVRQIKANGGSAAAMACDVTNSADVISLIKAGVKTFGRVDVLVSNAGIVPPSGMSELLADELDRSIYLNIRSVLQGIAAALPVFEKQGSGHFINVSLISGIRMVRGAPINWGSTRALAALSDTLRQMVFAKNIRTTLILSGAIDPQYATTTQITGKDRDIAGVVDPPIPPQCIADAIAFAVGQPATVSVHEIVMRSTTEAPMRIAE